MKMGTYRKVFALLGVVIILNIIYLVVDPMEQEMEIVLTEESDEEHLMLGQDELTDMRDPNSDNNDQENIEETIYVFICGAVNQPAVYEVPPNTRVFEVLELAGGLTEEADQSAVNQAAKVVDGMSIYFPTKEEVIQGYEVEGATQRQLININLADKETLMTIPGIGEAKAESIINYRLNEGPFQSIEEIMNITGIKEGIFEKIKNFITI